ncbi:MAG: Fpg/Nei family DNA glycosylase [Deltaproteobacteria bacterium]|nr:Fpg/Nei family DNA glycosylase [Deltaproteobacteria bacterium]MBW1951878.1 Fpg/Nei family DNA glycosylase [Deltaproteobacteria bacterium]MBW1986979.1 Fpg/Nei family DNA glycosylase [Deltaproteobacteria bacterium]MBW2134495.1 Fpg/Nei family DNA glycosylase [Deltaproteobacteria bacterium]
MPELPDVEIFKQYLDATSLHKLIEKVEVNNATVLAGVSASELSRTLRGRRFESARRHGKYLLVQLDDGSWLILHFGMTGYLKCFQDQDQEPAHSRLCLSFDNGFHLAFVCQRMLGKVSLARDAESFLAEKDIGPDALILDFPTLQELLEGRKAAIKSILMNQKLIAGLGNIYTDEILFQAGLNPATPVSRLGEEQLQDVFEAIKQVLRTAIDCRADPDQMPRFFLLPQRHPEGKCPHCHHRLARCKIAGRTTYYCPYCQAGGKGHRTIS